MTADALSGAAWASIGAGVLVALLIVGTTMIRWDRKLPPVPPPKPRDEP
jgi:hypothetical protein